ncbi:MAG: alpha/beta fold hydrolase [Caldilineaceae bacterium]
MGYYTPHLPTLRQGEAGEPALAGATHLHDNRRGLVMILHGWEGCSHSNYNLLLTAALTRAGFDVVRLNLRDHGPNLHLNKYALNPGIFLGILIEEAVHATQLIARMAGDAPFYMVGASMGGNFVLRMALRHAIDPIPNLQKVIAINPAIDPARATDNVDRNPLLRRYFRRRWARSLLAKQELYPDLYEFAELRSCPTIRQMTEQIIRQYGDRFGNFRNADEYFSAYAVAPEDLADLTVATEIITAVDDPIIDAAAFDLLPANPLLSLQLHPTGGHVGYVDLFPVEHHLPRMVLRALLPLGADEHFGKVSTM